MVLLHADEEDQDRDEGLDRVGPAAEGHVSATNVVVGGDVTGGDAGEESVTGQLDVLHDLEGESGVAEENVDAEETDEGEVTEVAVKGLGAVLASDLSDLLGALAGLLGTELLVDLRLLHERIEDVQDRVARPDLAGLSEHVELLLSLVLGAGAPLSKRLELVDELVEHVPEPLDREVKGNGAVRVQQVVEQLANVLVRLETVVNGGLETSVDVTEVELAVKSQEDLVVLNKGSDELSLGPLGLLVVGLHVSCAR